MQRLDHSSYNIPSSLPITGSSLPSLANCVKSVLYLIVITASTEQIEVPSAKQLNKKEERIDPHILLELRLSGAEA